MSEKNNTSLGTSHKESRAKEWYNDGVIVNEGRAHDHVWLNLYINALQKWIK